MLLIIIPLYALFGEAQVEKAHVAGSFYPANKNELLKTVDSLLGELKNDDNVKALIVPHAGYIFSGPIAGSGFKHISKKLKKIFILAVNHNADTPNFKFACSKKKFFETPLGKVKVSNISQKLLKNKNCSDVSEAFNSHIIEVELPFLQKILTDFEIIPIVISTIQEAELNDFAEKLSLYFDDKSLIVVSSDLSHYKPYKVASSLDKECIGLILENNPSKIMRCEACGLSAIYILSKIALKNGWTSELIDYKNSGDTAGEKMSVVGYAAIVYKKEFLSKVQKKNLLNLARQAIKEKFTKSKSKTNFHDRELKQKKGCFVTIHKHGKLRGCIGSIFAKESLFECVKNNAINAAFYDFRFTPLKKEELNEIEIEISILSEPLVYNGSKDKLLEFLIPMKHGVILRRQNNSATYLPQVWSDLPDKSEFLKSLCLKGGMEESCWKNPLTTVETYEAFVFNEKTI